MKVYAIGDIHGCLSELKKMHEMIDRHIRPDDVVVYIGDYIDRGSDSKGVVDEIIHRQRHHQNLHVTLKGNHEDMMMSGEYWLMNGGAQAIASYGLDPYELGMEVDFFKVHCPEEHRAFYKNLQLYEKIGKVVFVHANIDPELPLENQYENVMLWNRNLDRYKGMYRDGVTVVRGHTPITNVFDGPNHIMIDTGCVFGNKLTCLVIDPEDPEVREYLYVKSEQPEW